jgi:hypothetical protein
MPPDADTLEKGTRIAERNPLDSNEKEALTVRSFHNMWYALGIFVVCCALLAIILPTTLVLSNKSETSGVGVEVEVDSEVPEDYPSSEQTRRPTKQPTKNPTATPTRAPTLAPVTAAPDVGLTLSPIPRPTTRPTSAPIQSPTPSPTSIPTNQPTGGPNQPPTRRPTKQPTRGPTFAPTRQPTREPNPAPTIRPTDTEISFLRIEGPFEANLTLFNEDIVGQPYAVPALLREDLENAGRFFLGNVVKRNTNVKGFENVGFGGRNPSSVGIPEVGVAFDGTDFAYATITASSPVAAVSAPVAAASVAGPAVGNTVNDFGTNNQEKDVEEGDVIVSDGERGK